MEKDMFLSGRGIRDWFTAVGVTGRVKRLQGRQRHLSLAMLISLVWIWAGSCWAESEPADAIVQEFNWEIPSDSKLLDGHAGNDIMKFREAAVTAVATNRKTGSLQGSTIPVMVRIAETPGSGVGVGVMQEFFGGASDTIVASAWLAAVNASQLQNKMLSDYEVIVKVGGHIDGPSMGMLLTATMTALMRGESILKDVTMTGAIHPDGTVGPVGGIPYKMQAAKELGMKRFGYPATNRISLGAAGKDIDLRQYGKKIGLQVTEIHDVYDAYELLTGKALPRPVKLDFRELELNSSLVQRVRGATIDVRAEAEQRRSQCLKRRSEITIGKLPSTYAEFINKEQGAIDNWLNLGKSHIEASREAEDDASFASAYLEAMRADMFTRMAEASLDLLVPLARGDEEGVERLYRNHSSTTLQKLDSLKMSLTGHLKKITIGGQVDALHSFLHYGEAKVHHGLGRDKHREISRFSALIDEGVRPDGKTLSKREKALLQWERLGLWRDATIHWALAEGRAESASSWASFSSEAGPEAKNSDTVYLRLGEAYGSVASAATAYFRSLILESYHETTGASTLEQSTRQFAKMVDNSLPLIEAAGKFSESHEIEKLRNLGTDARFLGLEQFATGMFAYVGVAGLLAKHYNFKVESAADSQALGTSQAGSYLTNRRALTQSIEGARNRVLEDAAGVKEVIGFVPDSIKLNFDLASSLRDGTDNDKLLALKAYWRCSLLCYLTRMLNEEPPKAAVAVGN